MPLTDLGVDGLDAVVQHLSPQDMGRLLRTSHALAEAALPRHPSWALLRKAVQKGGWHAACDSAARRGDLQAVRWVHAQGWDVIPSVRSAAKGGHVHLLKWMHKLTPEHRDWNAEAFSAAAGSGHLESVKFLRAQTPPCPWSQRACEEAAEGGHVHVLRWLRLQSPPCPWHPMVCWGAAYNGRLESLRWLRSQSPPCPWYAHGCLEVARQLGHRNVVRWFQEEHGMASHDRFELAPIANANL